MRDVQKERDNRNIPIDRVGVRNVSYPVRVLDPEFKEQQTVATVSMAVALPGDTRGTHMSRFIDLLNDFQGRITLSNLENMTQTLMDVLEADEAELSFRFPYFIWKKAPISGIPSYSGYEVTFWATKDRSSFDFILEVVVPVQTLCPCSREISEEGAHNQRASISMAVRMNSLVWIEELVKICENSSSSPLYTLLKREDEKFVTESAYNNPRFVEDLVRECALSLEKDQRITWYRVVAVSNESIHSHDAFAETEKWKGI